MGISDSVLGVVADILLDPRDDVSSNSLKEFDDFVVALSADSGLPEREVQSLLVERMLQDPRHTIMHDNVIRLDDYLHLLQVN